MHAGQPRSPFGCQLKRRISQADWPEQMLVEIVAERLSADPLDGLSSPVDADAVVPTVAGIEYERKHQCRVLTGNDAGNTLRLHVPAHLGIPNVIDEAGCVSQEMSKRYRPFRWTQLRFS